MAKISKAVIPAAGFGTRFLPWTKSMPKEMLPIVDKPVIQIVVERLVAAGIKEIFLVISRGKEGIKNHFLRNSALEKQLKTFGKEKEFALIKSIGKLAKIHFLYQEPTDPYGNGTPLLKVARFLRHEPFIYSWGDEFIEADPPALEQILAAYRKYRSSIITLIRATKDEDYLRYGFIAGKQVKPGVFKVEKVAEKPGKENAPSDLGSIAPFIFTPSIFWAIKEAKKLLQPGKELYYNDAIRILMKKEPFYGVEIRNYRYYDTGNKLEYLKTVVEFGLRDPELGFQFKEFLERLKA